MGRRGSTRIPAERLRGTASPPAAQRLGVDRLQEVHPQQQHTAQQQQGHEGQQHQAAHQEGVHDLRAEHTVTACTLCGWERKGRTRKLLGLHYIILGHRIFRCKKKIQKKARRLLPASAPRFWGCPRAACPGSIELKALAHTAPGCCSEGLLWLPRWLSQRVSLFN